MEMTVYTAKSQPNDSDIQITDGRMTEVQLYCTVLSFHQSIMLQLYHKHLTLLCSHVDPLIYTYMSHFYIYPKNWDKKTNMKEGTRIFTIVFLFANRHGKMDLFKG